MVHQKLSRALLADAVGELRQMDQDFDRSVAAFGLPPLWARPKGLATLIQIILEQQVSLASAHAVYQRLIAGIGPLSAANLANRSTEELRRYGLTRQKASYCKDLARAIHHGEINLKSIEADSDRCAHDQLIRIRGIGTWSASIYLLMGLRRPDIWPDGGWAWADSGSATVARLVPFVTPRGCCRRSV